MVGEGLTSFMDELFVYQAGLITLEEYLKLQTKNLKGTSIRLVESFTH